MANKRKYRKGALITSIGELAEQEFICHGPNVYHNRKRISLSCRANRWNGGER